MLPHARHEQPDVVLLDPRSVGHLSFAEDYGERHETRTVDFRNRVREACRGGNPGRLLAAGARLIFNP